MVDNIPRVDEERIRMGRLPNALIGEDTDVLADLCKRWASLPGFERRGILRKVCPAREHWIIALAGKHLTELSDPIQGARRLMDEQIREVKDLIRSGG